MAGFLIDLESGATLAAEGIMNPQISYGEDVMSRLAYAMAKKEHLTNWRWQPVTGSTGCSRPCSPGPGWSPIRLKRSS